MSIIKIVKNISNYIKKIIFSDDKLVSNKENFEKNNEVNKIVNEIDSSKKISIINTKINIKFSRIDEYILFLDNKFKNNISLTNIDREFWEKFYVYNMSKLTKENITEYDELFYLVLEKTEIYFNQNTISLWNRWFSKKEFIRYKISNDISFLLRYSENLLRNKKNIKRLLSYEKFTDVDILKSFLDTNFVDLMNLEKINKLLNSSNDVLKLDVENFEVIDYKLNDIINEEKNDKININNIKYDNKVLEFDKGNISDKDEIKKLIDDIDHFEL
ncbi:hypothetical protein FDC35_16045 [Clostridium botulinum]|nr:hypothetical protein [Clostridium botulinum]NFP02348.1 hypothetical protein [Clostridium botulinum]